MTILEQLKAKNINVSNLINKNKEESLFKAIRNSKYKEAKHLIEYENVDVNIRDEDGWTPLMVAADMDYEKMVEFLIKVGAELDLKNSDGETALMLAAYVDSRNVARILITNGADTDIKDNFGRTASVIAKEMFSSKCGEYYLKNKYSENFAFYNDVSNLETTKKEVKIKNNITQIFTSQFCSSNTYEIFIFFKFFFGNRKAGDVIKYLDLSQAFKKEFNRNFEEIHFGDYQSKLLKDGIDVRIINNNDFVIAPSANEINDFLTELFLSKKTDNTVFFSKICLLFENRFNIYLRETQFYKFINIFNHKEYDIMINKIGDTVSIFPSYNLIKKFFTKFLEERTDRRFFLFSYDDIAEVFLNQYNKTLNRSIFYSVLQELNDSSQNYVIEELPEEIYICILLQNGEVVPLLFNNELPQVFHRNKIIHFSNSLSEINNYLRKQGLILRPMRFNQETYILTINLEDQNDNKKKFEQHNDLLVQEVKKMIQNKFYEAKIGCTCSKDFFDKANKYDIELTNDLINTVVTKVNLFLLDRKIVFDSSQGILQYELKGELNVDSKNQLKYVVETIICPICKEPFSISSIKSHILNGHINKSPLYRTNKGSYYCSNCGKNNLYLDIYDISYAVVLGHITGRCKEHEFWEKNH